MAACGRSRRGEFAPVLCLKSLPALAPSCRRVIVGVGILPKVVLQPIALAVPASWVARETGAFANYFTIEAPVFLAISVLVLLGSYAAMKEMRTTHAARLSLEDHALQTQAFLEAAMPPAVARSLLEGVQPEELARTFPSASIAFVLLEEYATMARGPPEELLAWLDGIYSAFDALVDAYGERVNKLEIVSNL